MTFSSQIIEYKIITTFEQKRKRRDQSFRRYRQIFPYANIIVGVLVLIVGFLFHWVGKFISILDWEFATKIGVAEKGMIREYRVYEEAIAAANVLMG